MAGSDKPDRGSLDSSTCTSETAWTGGRIPAVRRIKPTKEAISTCYGSSVCFMSTATRMPSISRQSEPVSTALSNAARSPPSPAATCRPASKRAIPVEAGTDAGTGCAQPADHIRCGAGRESYRGAPRSRDRVQLDRLAPVAAITVRAAFPHAPDRILDRTR